jgi:hypothetical protein
VDICLLSFSRQKFWICVAVRLVPGGAPKYFTTSLCPTLMRLVSLFYLEETCMVFKSLVHCKVFLIPWWVGPERQLPEGVSLNWCLLLFCWLWDLILECLS